MLGSDCWTPAHTTQPAPFAYPPETPLPTVIADLGAEPLPPNLDPNCPASPYALVLAPTRELAIQIELEAKKLTYKGSLTTVVRQRRHYWPPSPTSTTTVPNESCTEVLNLGRTRIVREIVRG